MTDRLARLTRALGPISLLAIGSCTTNAHVVSHGSSSPAVSGHGHRDAWAARQFGGTEADGSVRFTELAPHPSGDVIVTGCFGGNVDLGLATRSRGPGNFVGRFGAIGAARWIRHVPGRRCDNLVATDRAGNILWATQSATADAPRALRTAHGPRAGRGESAAVVYKLDRLGGHQWSLPLPGPSKGDDLRVSSIDVSNSGRIAIAGMLWGQSLPTRGGFVTRIEPGGTIAWSRVFIARRQAVTAISFEPGRESLIGVGHVEGDKLTAAGRLIQFDSAKASALMVRLSADGALTRRALIGDSVPGARRSAQFFAQHVRVARGGDVLVVGHITTNGGGAKLAGKTYAMKTLGYHSAFVVRLNRRWQARWGRVYGQPLAFVKMDDLELANDGDAVVGLSLDSDSSARFGAGMRINRRGRDVVLTRLDGRKGTTRWVHAIEGSGNALGAALLVQGSQVLVAAAFDHTVVVNRQRFTAYSKISVPSGCPGHSRRRLIPGYLLASIPPDPCERTEDYRVASFLARVAR